MRNVLMALCFLVSSFSVLAGDIDLKKSTLHWQGTKVTGRHWGTIGFKSGSITEKDGALTGGNFVVDMDSFTVTDLKGEWGEKLSSHLKNADFFEVKKHPTATLKVKKVEGMTVTADLTIKGKTNEVSFVLAKIGNAYQGTLTFDRTKFGIKYGSKSFFKSIGDKAIHDEVSLVFSVTQK